MGYPDPNSKNAWIPNWKPDPSLTLTVPLGPGHHAINYYVMIPAGWMEPEADEPVIVCEPPRET